MSAHRPCGEDTGAWVLDALPDEDARTFAVHLEACGGCRDEVARLQAGADVLSRAVHQVVAPPVVRDRVMTVVTSEASLLAAASAPADHTAPRRARWKDWAFGLRPAVSAAVACALLALGIGAGVLAGEGESLREVRATVSEVLPSTEAVLRIDEEKGTLLVAGLPAPSSDRVYQVWLRAPGPGQEPRPTDALFMPNGEGRATVEVPGNLDGVEAVLVTNEPAGGSEARPTTEPIIAAAPRGA
ncbi:MAG: anti-sigma factor [Solirubrobacteraceae bacterium MAG38_C4-C5]|nr:anti-sigma factor [Candidatus Siliceabacter maunaloa]